MNVGGLWRESNALPELTLRVREILLGEISAAELVVSGRVAGIDLQRPREVLDGFVRVSTHEQRVTEVIVRFRILRREGGRGAEVFDRFAGPVGSGKRDPEVRLHVHCVGTTANERFVLRDGPGPVPTIGSRIGEVESRIVESRLQAERGFELGYRLVVMALLAQ